MADGVYEPPRKKAALKDFDFCYGAGLNWIDLTDNTLYFIGEYKELEGILLELGIRLYMGKRTIFQKQTSERR